jgi:hypothetical protein
MKTTITLTLDSAILKEVRMIAAAEEISISKLLAAKLREIVREHKGYARSKRRALAPLSKGINHGWVRPASRDELHQR